MTISIFATDARDQEPSVTTTTAKGNDVVRNTEMTLRRQLNAATRLLANEQAVNRVLRRYLEPNCVLYDLNPTVIIDEGRINQASELIARAAAQCDELESLQNYHTLKEILTPGPLPRAAE